MLQADVPLCPTCGHIMLTREESLSLEHRDLVERAPYDPPEVGQLRCFNCGETAAALAVRLLPNDGVTFGFDYPGKPPDPGPIPMLLWCPDCGERHVDAGEFATKPHHTHACQHCGLVWRPAIVPTVGVRFLPGCQHRAQQDKHRAQEDRLADAVGEYLATRSDCGSGGPIDRCRWTARGDGSGPCSRCAMRGALDEVRGP